MGQLSEKARGKVAGQAWDNIRSVFNELSETLLSVSPATFGELTTIYIKFTLTSDPSSPVYAVIWVKTSKSLVVGLALPEESASDERLTPAPKGMSYKNLTGYLTIEPGQDVPRKLKHWAAQAYNHISSVESSK